MFIAPKGARESCSSESKELRWFTAEQTSALQLDPGLRRMTAKWQALVARRPH